MATRIPLVCIYGEVQELPPGDALPSSPPAAPERLHVRDQKASGTAGDTFSSGAYQASVLNTVVANTLTGASLASNQVTLAAGTYRVHGVVAANGVAQRAALYDVTNAVYLLTGLNNSGGGPGNGPYAFVDGDITLAGTVALELQLRVNSSGAGLALSYGDPEVYADLVIERLS